jgi:hypothetical protein
MSIMSFGVVLTLSLSCAFAAQSLPPGYIVIDGSTTPEQIPEHIMWSSGFDAIVLLKEKQWTDHGPLGDLLLQLPKGDIDLLYAEVAIHKERRERCHEKGRRIYTSMQGQEVPKIEAAMKANTLGCRQEVLDSADRLLSRMSLDGRIALTNWMLNERTKVKSMMAKSELEFFRLPR